jgi:hypothetical protein
LVSACGDKNTGLSRLVPTLQRGSAFWTLCVRETLVGKSLAADKRGKAELRTKLYKGIDDFKTSFDDLTMM